MSIATKGLKYAGDTATERHDDQNTMQVGRSAGEDRQEQYQNTRARAIAEQNEQDREARIRRRAHEIWQQEGQPEGLAWEHWERAIRDLRDAEDRGQKSPDELQQSKSPEAGFLREDMKKS